MKSLCGLLFKLLLINVLFFNTLSYADDAKLATVRFKTLDNLKLETIGYQNAAVQDQQGFMWFAGTSGLARYDGHNLKIYRHVSQDSQSLSENFLVDLLVDRKGRMWIATRGGGLNLYDPAIDGFIHYKHIIGDTHSLSNDRVTSLFERKDGKLWLTTDGGGLNLFDPKALLFTHYFNNDHLTDVYEDNKGIVWIGTTNEGLIQFTPNSADAIKFSHNPTNPSSLSHNNVLSVFVDSKLTVWVGTQGGGLNQMNRENNSFGHYIHSPNDNNSLGGNVVADIAERNDGKLWVATDGGGLNLLTIPSGNFEHFYINPNDSSSLLYNKIRSIYQDNSGDWWFGHFPSGVSKVAPYASNFSNYRHEPLNKNSLTDNGILVFSEGKNGGLWVGTEDGLNYINRDSGIINRYLHAPDDPKGLAAPAVLAVLTDSYDELWAGTWGGGLSRLSAETNDFINYTPSPEDSYSINGQQVWTIYEDKNQNLWIGTEVGLEHYDRKTNRFSIYKSIDNDPNSITSGIVHVMYEDKQGNFWIGTSDGLSLFDRETGLFTRYQHNEDDPLSLSGNLVWCITQDSKGRLWVGSQGGGLNMLNVNSGEFTTYQVKDGLAHNTVTGIIEDNAGYLWISTGHGLSRFNYSNKKFRNYTTLHGLPGNLFNRPAYLKTREGELVFGSTEGLTIIKPSTLFENTLPPPVALTEFQLFNQPVAIGTEDSPLKHALNYTDSITLRHEQSVFSLTFTALNYRIPEMNQYSYMLEGFDRDWNNVGNNRTATYTNLDAGDYVFRVKAANSDGVWNDKGVSLKITILPPFWRTWWAYSMYGLLIISLFLLYFRRQQGKVKLANKLNLELEKKVAERTLQLEKVSITDYLTGLKNRRYLMQNIDKDIGVIIRKHQNQNNLRTAIELEDSDHIFFILDLDDFKQVNDNYGHAAGDAVLVQIKQILESVFRETDYLIRWGGEEFLVMARFTDRNNASELAERLRKSVENHIFDMGEGKKIKKTCSIGFASFPFLPNQPTNIKWSQVVDIADHCLYAAKKSGRNAWVGLNSLENYNNMNVFNQIKTHTQKMINSDELEVLTSINKETEINW